MKNKTRKELTQFFIFTFIYSWILWLPGVLTNIGVMNMPAGLFKVLELVGAISPAVVAMILI